MGHKEELQKIIDAKRRELIAQDRATERANEDFWEQKAKQFQVMKGLLKEMAEGLDPVWLNIHIAEDDSSGEVKVDGIILFTIEPDHNQAHLEGAVQARLEGAVSEENSLRDGFAVWFGKMWDREDGDPAFFESEEEVMAFILPRLGEQIAKWQHLRNMVQHYRDE